jgi:hypothetical protein
MVTVRTKGEFVKAVESKEPEIKIEGKLVEKTLVEQSNQKMGLSLAEAETFIQLVTAAWSLTKDIINYIKNYKASKEKDGSVVLKLKK